MIGRSPRVSASMLRAAATCSAIACLAISQLGAQFAETPHPRLWPDAANRKLTLKKKAGDQLAARLYSALVKRADQVIDERTCRYEIPDGKRLLAESRRAVHQTMLCSWAWRMTGDRKYLERAIAELNAACAMKDWNPSHFLDTAEMAAAVAIGYDWLHDSLTPEQRAMCETAIRDKALIPARDLNHKKAWWNRATNNWAQVCGGGISLAAVSIQGRDHGLSEPLIRHGLDLLSRCEHFYQPDGLYPEGPGYWHYGTNYHVLLISAMEELGHPAKVPALLEDSGDSMIHLHGPTQLPFNFADGKAHVQTKTPAQAWIARHFKNRTQAADFRRVLESSLDEKRGITGQSYAPLQLAWLPTARESAGTKANHAVFRGEQSAAVFRSGWQPDAAWIAMKGGTPSGGHSQMDVGSFCYDAMGLRWIHDLGSDNYNMPGYFGSGRFTYFRNQNRSHNTLEINQQLQDPDSPPCQVIASSIATNPATATFDLTPAYAASAAKVHRSVEFNKSRGTAIIRDDIESPAGDVTWRAVTDAEASIDGNTVTLSKQGKSITIERLSKAGTWSVTAATPPKEIENPNKGFRIVTLTVPKKDRISIEVGIRP